MNLWLTTCVAIACAAPAAAQVPEWSALEKEAVALDAALKKRYPEAVVTPMLVPYGTDANGLRSLGVKSYGLTPVVLSATAIASIHGDAKPLPQDALGPAIQIIYDTVKTAAGR